jgi:hypothetical protein
MGALLFAINVNGNILLIAVLHLRKGNYENGGIQYAPV